MKKLIILSLITLMCNILFSQNNNLKIYVSLYKIHHFLRITTNNTNMYSIHLQINDTTCNLNEKEYFSFEYDYGKLQLIVKKKDKIIFQFDSLEEFYYKNILIIDCGINNSAKPNSIVGGVFKTDMETSNDYISKNSIEDKNHIVTIVCVEGEFNNQKKNKFPPR